MQKSQLNVRVRKPLRDAVHEVSSRVGFSQEELVEMALEQLFGSKEKILTAKCKFVRDQAKDLSLSFESPASQTARDMLN